MDIQKFIIDELELIAKTKNIDFIIESKWANCYNVRYVKGEKILLSFKILFLDKSIIVSWGKCDSVKEYFFEDNSHFCGDFYRDINTLLKE